MRFPVTLLYCIDAFMATRSSVLCKKKRGQAIDVIQLWLIICGPSDLRCQHRTFLNYNNVQFQGLSVIHYQTTVLCNVLNTKTFFEGLHW